MAILFSAAATDLVHGLLFIHCHLFHLDDAMQILILDFILLIETIHDSDVSALQTYSLIIFLNVELVS